MARADSQQPPPTTAHDPPAQHPPDALLLAQPLRLPLIPFAPLARAAASKAGRGGGTLFFLFCFWGPAIWQSITRRLASAVLSCAGATHRQGRTPYVACPDAGRMQGAGARQRCSQCETHRLMSSAAAALASSGVSFFLGALCGGTVEAVGWGSRVGQVGGRGGRVDGSAQQQQQPNQRRAAPRHHAPCCPRPPPPPPPLPPNTHPPTHPPQTPTPTPPHTLGTMSGSSMSASPWCSSSQPSAASRLSPL